MSDTVDLEAGGQTVALSNPGKVLFPRAGVTKADLAQYYLAVAERMLPHVAGRAVAMERYPDGIDGERFFQKNVPGDLPDWIHRVTIEKEGGTLRQLVADNAATLVYLADLACITPHAWLSRVDLPERPDQLVFDLDPPDDDFEAARAAALSLRPLLEELDLPSFVKTTGKRGLHVVVPLRRNASFDAVRGFARKVAGELVARRPSQFTLEEHKEARGGRLYVDLMRNGYAQMAVAPYALRATPSATVATPLSWDELGDRSLRPDRFTLRTLPRRLAAQPDPWEATGQKVGHIGEAAERLSELRSAR